MLNRESERKPFLAYFAKLFPYREMTEFGATLTSFIRLAGFPHQSAYAEKAGVSDSTVTRTTGGGSFSTELLAKLIAPFSTERQVELSRAFIRDRLREGPVDEAVIAEVFGAGGDSLANLRPDLRQLLHRLAAELNQDPVFQRTLEDLLELVDTDSRARRLYLVAEPAKAKPKLPRGRSQENAG